MQRMQFTLKVMHLRSLGLCSFPRISEEKRDRSQSNLTWELGRPSRDITYFHYMISNVIFQVEPRTSDSRALNETCEETCSRTVTIMKHFSLFSLLLNTHRKKCYKSFYDILYISFNDNKILIYKKKSTKVQTPVLMMAPCELQRWHFLLIEQVYYCKKKTK